MNTSNIYNILVAIFLLSIGFYVQRAGKSRGAQKQFFLLCLALAAWMFCHGFRVLLPEEFREIALNWTLIPILFVPRILHKIVNLMFGFSKNRKESQPFHWIVLVFLLSCAFFCNAISIIDTSKFTYMYNYSYHLVNAYALLYISYSCYLMFRSIFRSKGDLRIRAFLFSCGSIIALIFTITCTWILPYYGLYWASKSVFGFLPFALFWSIAILHYDAFEIREYILDGKKLPFLNRISSFLVLGLFRILDPNEYSMRLLISKANVVLNVASKNHELAMEMDLEKFERAEMVAGIFQNRIK
ncbi:histidine kinase N-terminal 7TM domain-containing protein [Leptospira sp. mild_001]|uniref:LIC10906 family membrane protein n=1 Tax=Leptospira TaxID=171 RepID=UPI001E5E76F0|nr:histidine kinase N-terminal 7TM domain-containing protein [Leptospira sp. mild_001]